MSGWDDTPANEAFEESNGFAAVSNSEDEVFNGIVSENISRHANTFRGDDGCRYCHEHGHFARDCSKKPEGERRLAGACYKCGQAGHSKAECPEPKIERSFDGICRICGEQGHSAKRCEVNQLFAKLKIEDLGAEDAWKALSAADEEKDVDDVKKYLLVYARAYPQVTFEELENTFRDAGMNTHLIAKKQDVSDTHTIINLQGVKDQEYVVSIQWSQKPRRAAFVDGWPESPEQNLERLSKAGFVMDRLVQKCSNCSNIGHIAKSCPEEKREVEKPVITCANCSEQGHYARDCAVERRSRKPKGCRNCGSTGHIAKECPEPPNPDNVECRNCNQIGHFSKDCPERQPELCRNCSREGHRAKECTEGRKIVCRNCDEEGHASKECPKPRDWSRVKCNNCGEMGHGVKRCPQPVREEEESVGVAGGDGGWEDSEATAAGNGFHGSEEATVNGMW